ncbi:MAG: bifunctional phosphopantothenoylcysteine decarboxylase/phosphopantothenate--cysteine ligase CoaBC [Cellvibrionales bacterium]|nr:bifunctional phosphopantothenoylcysteine decarboxylase/phosphopantothenate--cysteine ligase CoaBC [Cellvibrionales bacterium]
MTTANNLNQRRILLGITGSVAAYKSGELVRELIRLGSEVRVVMTESAQAFVTPLTFQALSGHAVHTTLLDEEAERGMGHIELAKWADLILVAPASANFMARLNQGLADDLLTTLCLATDAPIAIAPAMNQAMWRDASTQENLDGLNSKSIHLLGPGSGDQACGDTGPGRMLEVPDIIQGIAALFNAGILQDINITITAGPTQEAIDPVRYLSNHSSGKMGYALAKACANAGANVTLISGPTALDTPERVHRMDVTSAQDMLDASLSNAKNSQLFIACAAVADYRPLEIAEQKIKKDSDSMTLHLVKNPDIISEITTHYPSLFAVGFAAETENLIKNAEKKLARKNLNVIVANDVSKSDSGFGVDINAVTLLTKDTSHILPANHKTAVAEWIVEHIAPIYHSWKTS